jgi:hypothetical protein
MFGLIAGEFAFRLNFVSLEVFTDNVSVGSLFVTRSSVNAVQENSEGGYEVGELIDQMLFAGKRNEPMAIELGSLMQSSDILEWDKFFFLILEPGKVCSYSETSEFLKIHKNIENKCMANA